MLKALLKKKQKREKEEDEMKKRAQVCLYIFVICAFVALGIIGYFILRPGNDEVMVGSKKFVTFNIKELFAYTCYACGV